MLDKNKRTPQVRRSAGEIEKKWLEDAEAAALTNDDWDVIDQLTDRIRNINITDWLSPKLARRQLRSASR